VLAVASVCTLVAVASCGDDDDNVATPGSGAATTEAPAATTGATTAGTGSTAGTEGTSGGTEGTSGGGGGEAPVNSGAETNPGTPVKGGTLVYGLEADSANGWAGYKTSCATSCFIPLESVSDSLFDQASDGTAVPLLVESVEHNADYTQWTLHLRDGIKFHDGTALDGAAVKVNIDSCRFSPLTATAYLPIQNVEASGQDVVLTLNSPWVALPVYFARTQCGYMMSGKWLSSLPDLPQRTEGSPGYDAAIAAIPADGDRAKPVGLGAFKFESYTPGNGNSFKATRNPDYWRGPNGITGEDLPYLDGIEAVVAVDIDGRANGLRSGQFDVIHTANADTISQLKDDSGLRTIYTNNFGDTSYIMLNNGTGTTIDPEGKNAKSPLLVLECRKALAEALDQERWVEERAAGLSTGANGPYPPGAPGYLEDTGYPKFDVAAAQKDMDTCLQKTGTPNINFNYNTTNDPFNVESNELVISMWKDAFGDKIQTKITPIEQGQYIGLALTGDFQAFSWRNHSGFDPDQQRTWWQSASAVPFGQNAPNFGRIVDPVIDENLTTIKTNADPAARKAAAEAINKQFGKMVYNLWIYWTIWSVISQPYVHGVEAHELPDGTKGVGLAAAGRHELNQMWCDNGKCE
jgi:peptide/nickel transport system substrate-binding protein